MDDFLEPFHSEPFTSEPFTSEPSPADGPPPAPAAAQAAPAVAQSTDASARSGHVIPGGNAKNTPIEEASDRDLRYWVDRLDKGLAEGTSRSAERDGALARAMSAELAQRAEAAQ